MKALKMFIFFTITYNIVFVLILNLQYVLRFDREFDLATLMYSLIFSIHFCLIPLVCVSFSWFISNKLLFRKSQINPVLNRATFLLMTIILIFIIIEIMGHVWIVSLLIVSSTILTLFLLFYVYRKDEVFTL